MSVQQLPGRPAAGHIPKPEVAVHTRRGKQLTVRAERYSGDRALVSSELPFGLMSRGIVLANHKGNKEGRQGVSHTESQVSAHE
jgi:hypothetical protein